MTTVFVAAQSMPYQQQNEEDSMDDPLKAVEHELRKLADGADAKLKVEYCMHCVLCIYCIS